MSNQWPDICTDLDDYFEERYFYHQDYSDVQFILPLIIPEGFEDKSCFYTKVLNYFAVTTAYGTTSTTSITWPPGDSTIWDAAVARHKLTYERYPYYKTVIIIDYSDLDSPSAVARMDLTRDKIIELCTDLADYGWSYRIVMDKIEYTQFVDEMNDFYKKK